VRGEARHHRGARPDDPHAGAPLPRHPPRRPECRLGPRDGSYSPRRPPASLPALPAAFPDRGAEHPLRPLALPRAAAVAATATAAAAGL